MSGAGNATCPIRALRAAIVNLAAQDAQLAALLGAAPIFADEPRRGPEPIRLVFGDALVRDWSTGTETGHEHECEIEIWYRDGQGGAGLAVADRLARILHEAQPALEGHVLINLRVVSRASARDQRARASVVRLRLRATTEIA